VSRTVTIRIPEEVPLLKSLKAGDEVLLSGTILSARDQAHKRVIQLLETGVEALPVDLAGQIIYYMGPAPTPEGRIIGSCGPTTSGRMDRFTPALLELGLAGMIGKGPRSDEVMQSMKKTGAVYFYAYGGCGALYASTITSISCLAFPELGPEAIYRLEVENFPVLVAIDTSGESLFS
jgi:fumarate hydratase subunit beta